MVLTILLSKITTSFKTDRVSINACWSWYINLYKTAPYLINRTFRASCRKHIIFIPLPCIWMSSLYTQKIGIMLLKRLTFSSLQLLLIQNKIDYYQHHCTFVVENISQLYSVILNPAFAYLMNGFKYPPLIKINASFVR